MKKIVLFVALLSLAGVSVLSAQARGFWSDEELETVRVSGTAVVDDWGRVAIRSGAHTYHLMPAFALPETVEITDGARVEVVGYEMPGPRFGVSDTDRFLRASELSVGGRTYVLGDHGRASMMNRGGSTRAPQRQDAPGRAPGRAPRR